VVGGATARPVTGVAFTDEERNKVQRRARRPKSSQAMPHRRRID
jgi:hypothetical protein